MILVIGLGNPGEKYKETRHNIGWIALDEFKKKNNFGEWNENKKTRSTISKGIINEKEILLAKPVTFMNLSGEAIVKIISYYKIIPEKIIIVHDDIDIEIGKIKIIEKRGAAGHKGVLSITKILKTKNFIRIRVGIKPKGKKPSSAERFVISQFNQKERKILKETVEKTIKAIEIISEEGIQKAMNIFNKKS
jgi:peptidyl-tRNA hydrolase, PTH1 family